MVALSVNSSAPDYDVIILGAGAAGLFCALTAAQRGRRVLVLEKANRVGKKILMSGGGRCNFTNYSVEAENYLSSNPHFCKAALKRYTQWDFIALVEHHGIAYEERKLGQLFCRESAADVLAMLLRECESAGVDIRTKSEVHRLESSCTEAGRTEAGRTEAGRTNAGQKDSANDSLRQPRFSVLVSQGPSGARQSLSCGSLVVATGALSIPTLGGSGLGYDIAKDYQLPVLPCRAGLVPFMFSDAMKPMCEKLSGLAVDVCVSCNGQSFTESMLFTHRGISGPAILQISNYWHPGDSISVNLLPDDNASQWLLGAKRDRGSVKLKALMQEKLAKALVTELQALWLPALEAPALAECSDKLLTEIGSKINVWRLKPSATEGYRTAEVTLGGVDTAMISSKTMEVKTEPGLYFIGEVLDVTGHLGGYNFQWAWSSGYSAGLFA